MQKNIKHLIVDSGAFIKNAPIHEYAENVYTVNGAVKEIKDKATLQRLQVLPYTLHTKEPSPEAFRYVAEFSKKTGDYASLSTVDLQIAALTYQLHKEFASDEPLLSDPTLQITSTPTDNTKFPGFYYPKEKEAGLEEGNSDKKENEPTEKDTEVQDEDDDVESDNEDAWLTADSIKDYLENLSLDSSESMTVACVTTDFAIQNILLQMGLHVISVEGMMIRQTRVFILRCHACYKTTNDVTKKFCPNCGNKTMKKVAVSVNEDGSKNIHINFRRAINIRGTKYSLPTPQGGKFAKNPILCADQRVPQNRAPKACRADALQMDCIAGYSPFATNDVYSRAAAMGVRKGAAPLYSRRNPNEKPIRTGNKKK